MNLVGITSSSDLDFSSLPSQVIEVAKRNTDGSYDIAVRYLFGWNNDFNLEPGEGYWFKTTGGATWTYNPI